MVEKHTVWQKIPEAKIQVCRKETIFSTSESQIGLLKYLSFVVILDMFSDIASFATARRVNIAEE